MFAASPSFESLRCKINGIRTASVRIFSTSKESDNDVGVLVKCALLGLLLLPNAVLCQSLSANAEKTLVLSQVTIIDATGSPAKPNMSVVIHNHRIAAINETGKSTEPPNAEVVDAKGRFLIPGLWDMHAHTGERDIYLPLYLANGLTGVRDMGGDLEEPTGELSSRYVQLRLWREEIEQGSLLGPHMVIAGFLIDGFKWPGDIPATNATEGRQAVEVLARVGVDFIKVKSFLSRETYFAIADEAMHRQMVLAGHVPDLVRVAEASDAGQKSIEHLTGVSLGCSASEKRLMDEKAKAFAARDRARYERVESQAIDTFDIDVAAQLFAKFVKNGTWQVPTLIELRNNALGRPGSRNDQSEMESDQRWRYLPAAVRERWKKERDARSSDVVQRQFANEILLTRKMHDAGVLFLAGTDSASTFTLPGFALHEELELLVKAGFSPMEALQTATLNPARYLGREKEFGTVEAGKIADLVLLDANPLDDISNTTKIRAVIVNGRYLGRTDLDDMLKGVERAAQ